MFSLPTVRETDSHVINERVLACWILRETRDAPLLSFFWVSMKRSTCSGWYQPGVYLPASDKSGVWFYPWAIKCDGVALLLWVTVTCDFLVKLNRFCMADDCLKFSRVTQTSPKWLTSKSFRQENLDSSLSVCDISDLKRAVALVGVLLNLMLERALNFKSSTFCSSVSVSSSFFTIPKSD